MKNSDIADLVFRKAVEAIDIGDIKKLEQLLQQHPELVTKHLETPNEEGYFKNPYLLWFIADNPIRHEKLPDNIVEITNLIINALQKNRTDDYQQQVDYTLSLVCTGRIPQECNVQIPLMELLINEGAKVKGGVLGPIGQNNMAAAKYLLDKGADYNLATAIGLDRSDDIRKLIQKSTASELYVALVVASFFGKAGIISLLIKEGAEVNGQGMREDFGGFHSHATALHQAVYSGSLEAVKLLAEAGANLSATDKLYNGTPLGWAMHMQTVEDGNKYKKEDYAAIEEFLNEMNKNVFFIREATKDDVPALAALHTRVWKETYLHHPDPPTYQTRLWQWEEQFNYTDDNWFCLVIESNKGELIGFAKGQKYSHSDLPAFAGELNKIYVLSDYRQKNLGNRLFGKAKEKFLEMNINSMVVFGNGDNTSNAFYEAMGGEKLLAPNGEFHGGYGWFNLHE